MSSSSSASDIDEDDHVDGTDLADEHFSDWVEETVDSTLDLFSDATFTSPAACLEHMKAQHGIDMDDVKAKMNLDMYGSIRMVNFVRSEMAKLGKPLPEVAVVAAEAGMGFAVSLKSSGEAVFSLLADSVALSDDQYLQPQQANDPLLWHFPASNDEDWGDSDDEEGGGKVDGVLAEEGPEAGSSSKAELDALEQLARDERDSAGMGGAAGAGSEDMGLA